MKNLLACKIYHYDPWKGVANYTNNVITALPPAVWLLKMLRLCKNSGGEKMPFINIILLSSIEITDEQAKAFGTKLESPDPDAIEENMRSA